MAFLKKVVEASAASSRHHLRGEASSKSQPRRQNLRQLRAQNRRFRKGSAETVKKTKTNKRKSSKVDAIKIPAPPPTIPSLQQRLRSNVDDAVGGTKKKKRPTAPTASGQVHQTVSVFGSRRGVPPPKKATVTSKAESASNRPNAQNPTENARTTCQIPSISRTNAQNPTTRKVTTGQNPTEIARRTNGQSPTITQKDEAKTSKKQETVPRQNNLTQSQKQQNSASARIGGGILRQDSESIGDAPQQPPVAVTPPRRRNVTFADDVGLLGVGGVGTMTSEKEKNRSPMKDSHRDSGVGGVKSVKMKKTRGGDSGSSLRKAFAAGGAGARSYGSFLAEEALKQQKQQDTGFKSSTRISHHSQKEPFNGHSKSPSQEALRHQMASASSVLRRQNNNDRTHKGNSVNIHMRGARQQQDDAPVSSSSASFSSAPIFGRNYADDPGVGEKKSPARSSVSKSAASRTHPAPPPNSPTESTKKEKKPTMMDSAAVEHDGNGGDDHLHSHDEEPSDSEDLAETVDSGRSARRDSERSEGSGGAIKHHRGLGAPMAARRPPHGQHHQGQRHHPPSQHPGEREEEDEEEEDQHGGISATDADRLSEDEHDHGSTDDDEGGLWASTDDDDDDGAASDDDDDDEASEHEETVNKEPKKEKKAEETTSLPKQQNYSGWNCLKAKIKNLKI
jgi:hypothetical protein